MSKKSSARDRLVTTAANLFQRQGYHGSGLNQILEESRAPKGSFYYYFPKGKEQLAEAAIQSACEDVKALIDKAFLRAADYSDGAARMGRLLGDWFKASDYGAGCPITSVLLETTPGSETLLQACRFAFDEWITVVEAHARRLGEDREAPALASALILAMEGAWILARARRSTKPFYEAARLRPA